MHDTILCFQGRGYPDISLFAMNYQIVVGGAFIGVYGTSASAPGVCVCVFICEHLCNTVDIYVCRYKCLHLYENFLHLLFYVYTKEVF